MALLPDYGNILLAGEKMSLISLDHLPAHNIGLMSRLRGGNIRIYARRYQKDHKWRNIYGC